MQRVAGDGAGAEGLPEVAGDGDLAHGPGLALGMTKKMVWNEWPMDLDAAIEQEAQAQALLLRAHDHREFYNAWMEKREPRFLGR